MKWELKTGGKTSCSSWVIVLKEMTFQVAAERDKGPSVGRPGEEERADMVALSWVVFEVQCQESWNPFKGSFMSSSSSDSGKPDLLQHLTTAT